MRPRNRGGERRTIAARTRMLRRFAVGLSRRRTFAGRRVARSRSRPGRRSRRRRRTRRRRRRRRRRRAGRRACWRMTTLRGAAAGSGAIAAAGEPARRRSRSCDRRRVAARLPPLPPPWRSPLPPPPRETATPLRSPPCLGPSAGLPCANAAAEVKASSSNVLEVSFAGFMTRSLTGRIGMDIIGSSNSTATAECAKLAVNTREFHYTAADGCPRRRAGRPRFRTC